jgi:hypothetical protein
MVQNLPFKFSTKDRLFYGRFEYAIGFYIPEASCLRELDHDRIDVNIERRRAWQEVAQQRIVSNSRTFGNIIMSRRTRDITDEIVENLHALADLLLTATVDYKLVVSVDQAWVYSNDLKLIRAVDQLDCLIRKSYNRAVITRPKDTIQLKKPRHKYRSYLRSVKITEQQKNQLTAFLAAQNEWTRISPALTHWLLTPFHRTQDYFFIDYDTANWATMLALVHPGLIRKTLEIIPYK